VNFRGNWRKESSTAPSLLTKSCHDIDVLLWLLCSPPPNSSRPPHLPSFLTSTGSLIHFKKSRKPVQAKNATNCLSCEAEQDCQYSAKKIYVEKLQKGDTGWPVKIVVPDIESFKGVHMAEDRLLKALGEDYSSETPQVEIDGRGWYGRCVYESANDVCDNQNVTITWEDSPLPTSLSSVDGEPNKFVSSTASLEGRGAKTASFHMVAFSEAICERKTKIYGTRGEITADSRTITVFDFPTGKEKTYHPHLAGGGHGGGDDGLARQFVLAIDAVKNKGISVEEAQRVHIGCTLEEIIRSHAMVFAAEEARLGRKVVDWQEWWKREVESTT
jgi:predicted dehydrogenase